MLTEQTPSPADNPDIHGPQTVPKFFRQPRSGGTLRLHPIHQRTSYLIRLDPKLPTMGDLP
jgi:hypothetical protein